MKKHLSKIIIATLILLAIASSMIFADLIKIEPSLKVQVLYTLGTENPVLAVMLEDSRISVTDKLIEEEVTKRSIGTVVAVDGTKVTIDGAEYELIVFGDLTKDGKLNVFDASKLLTAYLDTTTTLEGTDFLRANLANTDEILNVFDVMRLLNLYVGHSTEALAKEYSNELEIVDYSVAVDSLVLELNMDTKFLTKAFTGMSATPTETILVENAVIADVAYDKNKITVTFTDLENGTYTAQIIDNVDYVQQGVQDIYAEQEFEYNKLSLEDIALYEEDGITLLSTAIGKDIEKIDVVGEFVGTVDGSFALEFKVYDHETERKEENLKDSKTVGGATYDNTQGIVTFDNVDITDIDDGYLVITLKYTSGNYEVELPYSDVIQKITTELKVSSAEINREDNTTTAQETTTLSLLLDLEEDVLANNVEAYVLEKPYVDGEEPEVPEVDDVKAGTKLTFTQEGPSVILSSDYEIQGKDLQQTETKYKLFVVLTDSVNETEVLAYDIPEFGATELKDVLQVVLGEDGVASWTPDATETGKVEGYRVYLYKGSDVVYTEVVTGTRVDLIDQIKADGVKAGDTFKVKVVPVGDGVDSLNAPGTATSATSSTITIEALTLGTVAFVTDPVNSTELTITYKLTAENLEKAMKNVEGLEISVCEKGAIDATENPNGVVDTIPMDLPEVEEVKKDEEYVYTIDLANYMKEDGEWSAIVKLIAKKASTNIDIESAKTGTFYKASITSVEPKVDHETAKITVKAPDAPSSAKVNLTYKDKNGGNVSVPNGTLDTPITLTNVVTGTEYSVKVELVTAAGAVLDTVENVKVKLADKETLTTTGTLEVGDTFVINKTKVTFDGRTLELDEVANKDFLVSVYEMLIDGDSFKLNEDGNGLTEITFVSDDTTDPEVTTRTATLNKALLAEDTEILVDGNVETLILKGTANDIVLPYILVDIKDLNAGVIDITNFYALRLKGTAEYDQSALVEDKVSADAEPYANFKVKGYDHVFVINSDYYTSITLCEGFLF